MQLTYSPLNVTVNNTFMQSHQKCLLHPCPPPSHQRCTETCDMSIRHHSRRHTFTGLLMYVITNFPLVISPTPFDHPFFNTGLPLSFTNDTLIVLRRVKSLKRFYRFSFFSFSPLYKANSSFSNAERESLVILN